MGARAQVHIKDEKVYLYTHWGSHELPTDVASALDRGRDRWTDPEYLARIIFDQMKGEDTTRTTGFGIGGSPHSDLDYSPIEIDCDNEIVTFKGETFTFEGYIEEFNNGN